MAPMNNMADWFFRLCIVLRRPHEAGARKSGEDNMPKTAAPGKKAFSIARSRAASAARLRTHYDVPQELPDDLSDLLRQVDENPAVGSAPDDEKKGAGAGSVH